MNRREVIKVTSLASAALVMAPGISANSDTATGHASALVIFMNDGRATINPAVQRNSTVMF